MGLIPRKTELLYGEQFRERIVYGPGGRLATTAVREFEVELDALFRATQAPAAAH